MAIPRLRRFAAPLGMTTRPEAVEQEKTDASAAGRGPTWMPTARRAAVSGEELP